MGCKAGQQNISTLGSVHEGEEMKTDFSLNTLRMQSTSSSRWMAEASQFKRRSRSPSNSAEAGVDDSVDVFEAEGSFDIALVVKKLLLFLTVPSCILRPLLQVVPVLLQHQTLSSKMLSHSTETAFHVSSLEPHDAEGGMGPNGWNALACRWNKLALSIDGVPSMQHEVFQVLHV